MIGWRSHFLAGAGANERVYFEQLWEVSVLDMPAVSINPKLDFLKVYCTKESTLPDGSNHLGR